MAPNLIHIIFPFRDRGSKQLAMVQLFRGSVPDAETNLAHQHGRNMCAIAAAEQSQPCAGASRRGTTAVLQQEQMATLTTRRAGSALMASVADDPAIHRLLPQFIVANNTILPHAVNA